MFKELAPVTPKGKIVFLGDSITEYFPLNELLSDYPILNRGIYGDTTSDVLKRLKNSVYDLKPSQVFLCIGTNDLGEGESVTQTAKNIQEICSEILETLPATELYLISAFPINENKFSNPNDGGFCKNSDIYELNAKIRQISEIVYIDAALQMKDKDGNLSESLTEDGLHFNVKGYLILSELLKKYLKNK